MSKPPDRVSRRHLLYYGASAAALLGAVSCKKGPAACDNVSGLSPDEVKTRKTLGYTDSSRDINKTCENCLQYVAPPASDQCGTCKVLKGPVHPYGYCTLFAAK